MHASKINRIWDQCQALGLDRVAFAWRIERASWDAHPSVPVADLMPLLPSPYYMDPPDGGSVTVLGQLQRMAEDAARYRQVRRKVCIVGDQFHVINLNPTYVAPDAGIELDAAIDAQLIVMKGGR